MIESTPEARNDRTRPFTVADTVGLRRWNPEPGDEPAPRRRATTTAARTRRIVIIAPPWISLPPPAYGGIEQVVTLQAELFARAGHEVTVVAAPGSELRDAHCVAPLDEVPTTIGAALPEWLHALGASEHVAAADVVIDHSGPLGALVAAHHAPTLLHVVHGPCDPTMRGVYAGLVERAPGIRLVGISRSQVQSAPGLPWAAVCHNALDVRDVPFRGRAGGDLVFLGRMSPEKGAGDAIRIARACGRRLLIAAKCREPAEREYFDRVVAPELGPDVEWLGELGPLDKYELLASAGALIFPIDWEEPFGMVMIEAMACGTPVLATRRGAVPEVVVDGLTGFVCDHPDELVDAARRLRQIDRASCRRHVEDRFGPANMLAAWSGLIGTGASVARMQVNSRPKGRPAAALR